MFIDREDAGKKLAALLANKQEVYDLVLAVPRGGIVVGAQIAKRLKCSLDVLIPKKIGLPHNPEVAVGAVAQDGTVVYNHQMLNRLGLTPADLTDSVQKTLREIGRRLKMYRGDNKEPDIKGKSIILVDDGIATGQTILAAIEGIKKSSEAKKVTLAAPVAPIETAEILKKEVNELVLGIAAEDFYSVGQFYQRFEQTTDQEVIKLLKQA